MLLMPTLNRMIQRLLLCFSVLCLSISLTACVATYKAAEEGVAGYRDLRIDKQTFYVEYTEAGRISWEQIRNFALKRCAELTKKHGYSYFDVLEKDEKVVFLKSDVNEVAISTMGNIANEPPITHAYQTGGRVEGKRVTLKIRLSND